LPGGLLKWRESWQEAAARETFEEVGIRVKTEDLILVTEVPGELGPRNPTRLFEVFIDDAIDVEIDKREIVNSEFVFAEDALKYPLNEHVVNYLLSRAVEVK